MVEACDIAPRARRRANLTEGAGTNSIGFGIRGGFGYEFARHWTVEGIVHHGFNAEQGNPTSFGISLNFIRR